MNEHDENLARQVIAPMDLTSLFAHQGISRLYTAGGYDALFHATLRALAAAPARSLEFSNFVDVDMVYGHRRKILADCFRLPPCSHGRSFLHAAPTQGV